MFDCLVRPMYIDKVSSFCPEPNSDGVGGGLCGSMVHCGTG